MPALHLTASNSSAAKAWTEQSKLHASVRQSELLESVTAKCIGLNDCRVNTVPCMLI